MIPLVPQFIVPQDVRNKQDCEDAAAKRWLAQQEPRLSSPNVTVLGDDFYCYQPLCQQLLDQQFNFILVCRPQPHTTLYEYMRGNTLSGLSFCQSLPTTKNKSKLLQNLIVVSTATL